MPALDFVAIHNAALHRIQELLPSWLPGGRFNGAEYQCGDATGGPGHSFSVNLAEGNWYEFAGGSGGADMVSLYAHLHGLPQGQAAKALAKELGVDAGNGNGSRPEPTPIRQINDWTPIIPVPANAPPPTTRHFRNGEASATWTYRDSGGRVLGMVCRFDHPGGGKDIIPLTFCAGPGGKRAWRFKSFPAPRPLYGLHQLALAPENAPVLIVEGEKACDAAQRITGASITCMTWPGGSKAVAKADWSALVGRRVAIWPDADEPGRQAAEKISELLTASGAASVEIVNPPRNAPKGWDLADAEADGWSQEQIFAHIAANKEMSDKHQFGFFSLDDLMAEPAPIDWVIHEYLEAEALAVLFGESGVCKSFLAIDWSMCIATGTPWNDQEIKTPGPVFYIAGEGRRGIQRRVRAWMLEHGDARGPFFLSKQTPQFLEPHSADQVREAVMELVTQHGHPRLIVIDTLSRCFGPGDENSTKDMAAFVSAMDALKDSIRCTILIVHHSGLSDKERSRGSGALKGALDFEFQIKKSSDKTVTLIPKKLKDHDEPEPMSFRPEVVPLGWFDPETNEEMTSIVLRKTNQVKKTTKALGGSTKIAFEALIKLVNKKRSKCNVIDLENTRIPLEEWRAQAYSDGISASDAKHAKRMAFTRAVSTLLERGKIGVMDDYYWIKEECTDRTRSEHVRTCAPAHKSAQNSTHPL